MNQSEFARRAGVSPGMVSHWANNTRVPTPESAERIADALGADVDLVLTLAGHRPAIEPVDPNDPKTRIVGLLNRLDLDKDNRGTTLEGILVMWLRNDHEGVPVGRG